MLTAIDAVSGPRQTAPVAVEPLVFPFPRPAGTTLLPRPHSSAHPGRRPACAPDRTQQLDSPARRPSDTTTPPRVRFLCFPSHTPKSSRVHVGPTATRCRLRSLARPEPAEAPIRPLCDTIPPPAPDRAARPFPP